MSGMQDGVVVVVVVDVPSPARSGWVAPRIGRKNKPKATKKKRKDGGRKNRIPSRSRSCTCMILWCLPVAPAKGRRPRANFGCPAPLLALRRLMLSVVACRLARLLLE